MKSLRITLVAALSVVFLISLSNSASAAVVQVPANDYYVVQVGEFGVPGPILQGSDLSFSWDSDFPLTLVVSGPSGIVESYSSADHGSDTIAIDETGEYFMTWTNSGSSDATLDYDVDVDMLAPVHDVIDSFLLGVIIAAIVIVVIVVLVIVLVLGKEHGKKPAQVQQYGPPIAPLAPNASVCPSCGAPIDSTTTWCSRCGTRLR